MQHTTVRSSARRDAPVTPVNTRAPGSAHDGGVGQEVAAFAATSRIPPGQEPGAPAPPDRGERRRPENAMLHLMSHLPAAVLLANALVLVVLLGAWLRANALRERRARTPGR